VSICSNREWEEWSLQEDEQWDPTAQAEHCDGVGDLSLRARRDGLSLQGYCMALRYAILLRVFE
jgi:hypothetical protein